MSSNEYMPRIADDLLAAKLRQAGAVVIRGLNGAVKRKPR